MNLATLRNGVEDAERAEDAACSVPGGVRLRGVRTPKKRVAELERASEIPKTAASRLDRARSPTPVIIDYIDTYRDGSHDVSDLRGLSEHGVSIAPSTYYGAVEQGTPGGTT